MKNEAIVTQTDRLILQKFDESMAEAVHLLSIDDANRRFQSDEVFETVEDARETIQFLAAHYDDKTAPQVYPILLKEQGCNIGHVELVPMGNGDWEIGYHIGEAFPRRGYAAEAVTAFLPVMMARWGLPYVLGVCVAENTASRGVMEKCGFVKEFECIGLYHGENRPICRYRFTLPREDNRP